MQTHPLLQISNLYAIHGDLGQESIEQDKLVVSQIPPAARIIEKNRC